MFKKYQFDQYSHILTSQNQSSLKHCHILIDRILVINKITALYNKRHLTSPKNMPNLFLRITRVNLKKQPNLSLQMHKMKAPVIHVPNIKTSRTRETGPVLLIPNENLHITLQFLPPQVNEI